MIMRVNDTRSLVTARHVFRQEVAFKYLFDRNVEPRSCKIRCANLGVVSMRKWAKKQGQENTINADITRRVPKTAIIR
jgi:hypothetical protein